MLRGTLLGLLIVASSGLGAQEKIVLSTPKPAATEYRVQELSMRWDDGAEGRCTISVRLVSNVSAEDELLHAYRGPEACTMLRALNKADLSAVSLQRRIMNRLIADKVIVGTAAGVPE